VGAALLGLLGALALDVLGQSSARVERETVTARLAPVDHVIVSPAREIDAVACRRNDEALDR
jgi:hypothetical protein